MGKVIGIDLGTTNSCVSVLEGGKPVIIPNAEGSRLTPSIVGFSKADQRLVGDLAKRQSVSNAENTIYSIKRFIGRRWEETIEDRSRVPYKCIMGRDQTVDVQIRNKVFTPQEISAVILQKLKSDAEVYLNDKINKAVITVPAYFTDSQRQATKDAGAIAGLDVLRIINEPTAAALAYGLDKGHQEHFILVYDLGGGTFDVSILLLGNGVFEVKATSGNNHLGGDDIDALIVNWLVKNFQANEQINLLEDKMAMQRLKEAAEKAKIELSTLQNTSINLPFITADKSGPKHLEVELTRGKFEDLACSLVESTLIPVNQALKDCNLGSQDIQRVLLVGGSTRMPLVQRVLQKIFLPSQIERSVNPDEAVALGAAIQAGVIDGEVENVLLLDVTPLSLGIETLGEVFTKIIDKNTTIPTSKSQIFSTAADGQASVEINVLQGERALAKDNYTLGQFLLSGIPPTPRGVPQIEVFFDIDVNGIIKVTALDRGTAKEQKITINSTGGLQGDEIERMRREAQKFAEQDRQVLKIIELRNQADGLFQTYETTLRENGHLISEIDKIEARNRRNSLAQELQKASNNSVVTIQSLLDQFKEHLMYIGTEIYKKGNSSPEISSDIAFETSSIFTSPSQFLTESGSNKTVQVEQNFDFESDETVANDYETVD